MYVCTCILQTGRQAGTPHAHTHAHTHTNIRIHTHLHIDIQAHIYVCSTMHTHCVNLLEYSLTEDRQTTELANMWQYNPCISHQITVEQVEAASNEVV